ncbi:MAG: beta-ketoacyl-ACP synthase III [Christensenellaceae bacterium]
MSIRIMGTGSYLPEKVVTNEDFEKIVDTSDEWITTRTGIKSRHYADGMTNVQMSMIAAREALKDAGLTKDDIGGIIVATVTNDMNVPSVASQLQRAFDIEDCFAFDVNAACTGFMYALKVASAMIAESEKPLLVVGTETLSRFTNFSDRASCILFGDGAGAVMVCAGDNLKYIKVYSKPDYNNTIEIMGMNNYENGQIKPTYITLKGQEVYKYATREVEAVVNKAYEELGIGSEDIDWFLMHQANIRIIQTAAKRLNTSMDKFYINIQEVANTSAASIPIALDEMNKKGLLKEGQRLLIAGFGGGLTSGCAVYEF